jgi:CRP-like cAMP-binding protein
MSPGESLGEMALLDGQPRSASASAIGSCTVLRLKRDDFLMHIHHSPISIESIIQILSERARHMTGYMSKWDTGHG